MNFASRKILYHPKENFIVLLDNCYTVIKNNIERGGEVGEGERERERKRERKRER